MKEKGHTIYSCFYGLVCEVGTICCGARRRGREEKGREKGKGGSPGINICLESKQKYY